MKTKVGIAGCNGNMGRRYVAILKSLEVNYLEWDYEDYKPYDHQFINKLKECTHFIIATPTKFHIEGIRYLATFAKPILCEKPIALDQNSLMALSDIYLAHPDLKLQMVNNYFYAAKDYRSSDQENRLTYYDYFNTGKDGLALDCIQLLRYAEHGIEIRNESPDWECLINGEFVQRFGIDMSYIDMVNDFVLDMTFDYQKEKEEILECHRIAFALKGVNPIILKNKRDILK